VTGAFITAGSVFFLVFSDSVAAQVAFVATLSVGECLWSPRLYEYTATIAPPGREASYMGLSQVPMFFAKMAVGGISGYLLTQYCPETGERQPHLMWGIIGATTLIGPIAIVALRRVIEGHRDAAPRRETPA
jgi:MFS family permease